MTDIQQARDVLAKWCELADSAAIIAARNYTSDTGARLTVGTAGNPDLLDALDALLFTAQREDLRALGLGPLLYDAQRLAAAIISADERMTS